MRMHLEGVKNATDYTDSIKTNLCNLWPKKGHLPSATPTSVPIAIVTTSTFPSVEIAITVPAIASEDIAETEIPISIRSPTIPATITRVMTVNKLLALPVPLRHPPATSLAHCIGRQSDTQQQTQH